MWSSGCDWSIWSTCWREILETPAAYGLCHCDKRVDRIRECWLWCVRIFLVRCKLQRAKQRSTKCLFHGDSNMPCIKNWTNTSTNLPPSKKNTLFNIIFMNISWWLLQIPISKPWLARMKQNHPRPIGRWILNHSFLRRNTKSLMENSTVRVPRSPFCLKKKKPPEI